MSFQDYVDERMLISHDILGKKEMKIKVVEISDESYYQTYRNPRS